jgi:hypothetical protein
MSAPQGFNVSSSIDPRTRLLVEVLLGFLVSLLIFTLYYAALSKFAFFRHDLGNTMIHVGACASLAYALALTVSWFDDMGGTEYSRVSMFVAVLILTVIVAFAWETMQSFFDDQTIAGIFIDTGASALGAAIGSYLGFRRYLHF